MSQEIELTRELVPTDSAELSSAVGNPARKNPNVTKTQCSNENAQEHLKYFQYNLSKELLSLLVEHPWKGQL